MYRTNKWFLLMYYSLRTFLFFTFLSIGDIVPSKMCRQMSHLAYELCLDTWRMNSAAPLIGNAIMLKKGGIGTANKIAWWRKDCSNHYPRESRRSWLLFGVCWHDVSSSIFWMISDVFHKSTGLKQCEFQERFSKLSWKKKT